MVEGQHQHRDQPERRGLWLQVKDWAPVLIGISLLSTCFVMNLLVIHSISKYSKIGQKLTKLEEYPSYLSWNCIIKGNAGKDWSCCPVEWIPSKSSCYGISNKKKSWTESQKNCSEMGANLMVNISKTEKDFITKKLENKHSYFMGWSYLTGNSQGQWINQTQYNESEGIWHQGERNNSEDLCGTLAHLSGKWAFKNVSCNTSFKFICKMTRLHL